jgi:hypothetical protein
MSPDPHRAGARAGHRAARRGQHGPGLLGRGPPPRWKPPLRGKVADAEEDGDPDRCTLQVHAWGRVRFDLKERVIVTTTVAGLLPALDLVHKLAARA